MDEVLDLQEQSWWKQYPAEDILVCVIGWQLSEENGRWLNDIRSDHERLALSCVKKRLILNGQDHY